MVRRFLTLKTHPLPSRPLIISRCRMRHFINLWYPKSLFLSNFVLSLASFYSSIILHNSILCYYFKQPHLIWCLSISLIFWDKKPKNFRKCHSFFFIDHLRCPAYFTTLRPLASIWIFHILALIAIFFSCDAFKCRHNYVPKSKTFQLSTLKIKISMQGLSLDF